MLRIERFAGAVPRCLHFGGIGNAPPTAAVELVFVLVQHSATSCTLVLSRLRELVISVEDETTPVQGAAEEFIVLQRNRIQFSHRLVV